MTDETVILEEEIAKPRHLFAEAWEMFRRNRGAVVALFVLVVIVLGAIFGSGATGGQKSWRWRTGLGQQLNRYGKMLQFF